MPSLAKPLAFEITMKSYAAALSLLLLVACGKGPAEDRPSPSNPIITGINFEDKAGALEALKSKFCTVRLHGDDKSFLLANASAVRPSVYDLNSEDEMVEREIDSEEISSSTCDATLSDSGSSLYYLRTTGVYKNRDFSSEAACKIPAGTALEGRYSTHSVSGGGYSLRAEILKSVCDGLDSGYTEVYPQRLYFIPSRTFSAYAFGS